jgi:natural product biosynthesis luciferase-like monooxygenase protein
MSESTVLSREQVARLTARLQRVGAASKYGESDAKTRAALPELGIIFFSGLTSGQAPYELLLDVARYVDEAGFHAIWTPERHFTEVGGAYPNPALLAAALATATQRVRLRAGSINLPLHDPLRVAEEWAVVDQLSNGRVDIAVAPGWHVRDFVLKPENFENKFDVLNDYREQLRTAWRGQSLERLDAFGQPHAIVTYPRPVQRELPIWLTTSQREQAWEFAGRSGFNVLTALINFGPKELERRIGIYRAARRAAGWDADAGVVSLMLHTYVDTDSALAIERVRPALTDYLKSFVSQHQNADQTDANDKVRTLQSLGADRDDFIEMVFSRYVDTSSLIGDLGEARTRLEAFRGMGVDEVACLVDFGLDKNHVLDSLRLLSQLIEHRKK